MRVHTFQALRAGLLVLLVVGLAVLPIPVRAGDVTLTSATIAGPATIPKGGAALYTLTLAGGGANDFRGQDLRFSVYDNDEFDPDDLLQDETKFTIMGDGTGTGNWTKTLTFWLFCSSDCIVKGVDGDAGQTSAEVYALIEFPFGTDLGESTPLLTVTCTSNTVGATSDFGPTEGGGSFLAVSFHDTETPDHEDGLASIQVVQSLNATANVPPFSPGTTQPVLVLANVTNPAQPARVQLLAMDVEGAQTPWDTAVAMLNVPRRGGGAAPEPVQEFTDLPEALSKVSIRNGRPGLKSMVFEINGTELCVKKLRPRELRVFSILDQMVPGEGNDVVVRGQGPRGALAHVLLSPPFHTEAQRLKQP